MKAARCMGEAKAMANRIEIQGGSAGWKAGAALRVGAKPGALSGFGMAAARVVDSALAFGFGDVTEVLPNGARFTLLSATDVWPELRLALAAPLVPLLAYASLGFLAGTIARVGAAALALALGAGVVLDLARGFLRALGARSVLPSDHLPSPLSDTSFVRFYVDVAQGVSNATFEHGTMSVWIPAAWCAAAAAIALVIVQRRDVP